MSTEDILNHVVCLAWDVKLTLNIERLITEYEDDIEVYAVNG